MSTFQQERPEVPNLISSHEWYQRGSGGPPGGGDDKKSGPGMFLSFFLLSHLLFELMMFLGRVGGCSAPEGIKKKKAPRKTGIFSID
jgi:hypothetical protein